MSGGSWEYVAAYVNNGHDNLTTYGENLINADEKYKDVYQASATDGASDSYSENYNLATPEKGKYGDAIYETSSLKSWYNDGGAFAELGKPFVRRGGYYPDGDNGGIYCYYNRAR